MEIIANEIPAGAVDGINKVFTFINDIDKITNLIIDGSETLNFVVDPNNKKVITVNTAPLVSIFADYYQLENTIDTGSDVTLGKIKTKIWNLLGQTGNSVNFSNEIIQDEINRVSRMVWKGKVINKLSPNQIIIVGKMYFTNSNISIRIKGNSVLTNTLSLTDISFNCSTDTLLSSGYVQIGGDIIKYTSKDSTTLFGVSGHTQEYYTNEPIIQLYELPTNTDKPYKIKSGNTEVEINTENNSYCELMRYQNIPLIKFKGFYEGDILSIEVKNKYVNLTGNNDICLFPESYGIDVIAYITAGQLGYDKGIPNAQVLLNCGYSNLRLMYADMDETSSKQVNKLRPKTYSSIR